MNIIQGINYNIDRKLRLKKTENELIEKFTNFAEGIDNFGSDYKKVIWFINKMEVFSEDEYDDDESENDDDDESENVDDEEPEPNYTIDCWCDSNKLHLDTWGEKVAELMNEKSNFKVKWIECFDSDTNGTNLGFEIWI